MESHSLTWLDHHPWLGRIAFLALGIVGTLFVDSGIANTQKIEQIRGDYRWQWAHVVRNDTPSVGTKAKECPP